MKRVYRRGFTLLEVMMAVAILGLCLTAILSAQAGAFANATFARNISIATTLQRCKMTELEEYLKRNGFQELDEADSGPCCDEQDSPGMRCSWRIEKPVFPEAKLGELDLNAGLDLSTQNSPLGGLPGMPGGAGAAPGAGGLPGGAGAAAGLLGLLGGGMPAAPGAEGATDADAGAAAGSDRLAETLGAAGSSEAVSGILPMLMGMVYPGMKSMYEASTRRVTVTVTFAHLGKDYPMELVQWVTAPRTVNDALNPAEQENVNPTGGGIGNPTGGMGPGNSGGPRGMGSPGGAVR
jgi:general secretion pathway protein I